MYLKTLISRGNPICAVKFAYAVLRVSDEFFGAEHKRQMQ